MDNIYTIQGMESAQLFSLTSDTTVQRNIGALRFLAKVKRGEKINSRDLFIRDNDSIFQRLMRTLRNATAYMSSGEIVESKEATLSFIQNVVDESITLIAVHRQDPGDDFKQRIADIIGENLESSKNGIWKLIETYGHDRKFISDAEAVLLTLDARVASMAKKGYMRGLTSASFMPKLDSDTQSDHDAEEEQ